MKTSEDPHTGETEPNQFLSHLLKSRVEAVNGMLLISHVLSRLYIFDSDLVMVAVLL